MGGGPAPGAGDGCRPRPGTVLHRTRTPLVGWFAAAWELTGRGGTTATAVQRRLGLGAYQTAWALLHRYRAAMAPRPGDHLEGVVEVDRLRLRGAGPGPGPVVLVAVERRLGGRCRLVPVPDGRARTVPPVLVAAVDRHAEVRVAPGRTAIAAAARAAGRRVTVTGAGDGPARVAAAVGCWLRGPLKGAVEPGHLPAYLDEFAFRAEGPSSHGARFHRLLVRAVGTPPLRYADLVAVPEGPGRRPGRPPATGRPPPPRPSAAPGAPTRPWRAG